MKHQKTISTSITIPVDLPVRNMELYHVLEQMFTKMYEAIPPQQQTELWNQYESHMQIMEQLFGMERTPQPAQLRRKSCSDRCEFQNCNDCKEGMK